MTTHEQWDAAIYEEARRMLLPVKDSLTENQHRNLARSVFYALRLACEENPPEIERDDRLNPPHY